MFTSPDVTFSFASFCLFVCLSVFCAGFLAIVAMWYARSKKYGEKNVMYDSYAWYNHMLSDTSQMKNMPEVIRLGTAFTARVGLSRTNSRRGF